MKLAICLPHQAPGFIPLVTSALDPSDTKQLLMACARKECELDHLFSQMPEEVRATYEPFEYEFCSTDAVVLSMVGNLSDMEFRLLWKDVFFWEDGKLHRLTDHYCEEYLQGIDLPDYWRHGNLRAGN